MIELAVKAGLPAVAVRTADPAHAEAVLEFMLERPLRTWMGVKSMMTKPGVLYLASPHAPVQMTAAELIALRDAQSTLILVNPKDDAAALCFDAGALVPPREMIENYLGETPLPADELKPLVPLLSGLDLAQVDMVVRLTMARDGSLTPRGVSHTRRALAPSARGLELVGTGDEFYSPGPELEALVEFEGAFLAAEIDWRLRPRGLLMSGPTGVGKTSGARYIARSWKLPLYRLDVGGLRDKYVGASERHLRDALAAVEQEEPCVLLIDEVDKTLRRGGSEDGVSGQMLGAILWWLSEHRRCVFTVMTCNDREAVPDELVRPGRVDGEAIMGPLSGEPLDGGSSPAYRFAYHLARFGFEMEPGPAQEIAQDCGLHASAYAHAEVVARVRQAIKRRMKEGG